MTYVRLDRDWYRVKFNLAGARADWGLKGGDRSVQFQKAHEDAAELSHDALDVLIGRPRRADESLIRLLEEILPAAIALWAATLDPKDRKPPPDEIPLLSNRKLRKRLKQITLSPEEALHYALHQPDVSATVRYNIACSQTLLKRYPEAAKTLSDALKQTPVKQRAQLAAQALKDPSLKELLANKASGAKLKEELKVWDTAAAISTNQ